MLYDDESKASVAYIYRAHLINKHVGTNHAISLVIIKLVRGAVRRCRKHVFYKMMPWFCPDSDKKTVGAHVAN